MIENEKDGFDMLLEQVAQKVADITIGGSKFSIIEASKRINDTSLTVAYAYYKKTLAVAENDNDNYKPIDAKEAKTTDVNCKVYGLRIVRMRDYRAFAYAVTNSSRFRAIMCITNPDGTTYAETNEKIAKVIGAFDAKPPLFEEVNNLAGWPEFDANLAAKAPKPADGAEKETEAGQDVPNGEE